MDLRLAVLTLSLVVGSNPVDLLTRFDDRDLSFVLVMWESLITVGDGWSESSDTFKLLSELDESFERSGIAPKLTLLVDDDEVARCSVELLNGFIKLNEYWT